MAKKDITADHGDSAPEPIIDARLRQVLNQAPGACFEADPNGGYTFVNRAWVALSGLAPEHALGEGWLEAVHPEDRERVGDEWHDAVRRTTAFSTEFRFLTWGEKTMWVSANAGPVFDDAGAPGEAAEGAADDHADHPSVAPTNNGYLGWLTDVTGRVDLERYLEQALIDHVQITEQLRKEESLHHALDQQFRAVFERAPIGISVTGFDGTFTQVNQALCDMTGYEADKVIGRKSELLLHPDDRQKVRKEVLTRLFDERSPHVAIETRLIRADGRTRWILADNALVRDDNDEPVSVLTIALDITDRKQVEERLAHEASHDPLTGLPNRALMQELIQQSMARTRRRDTIMAVMFVDLDRFKPVNDTYGHAVGDELLAQMGGRLRGALRLGDVVARYGGDEFILLCEEIGGASGARIVAGRVNEAVATPFKLSEQSVQISGSIGVVLSDGGDDVEHLLRVADAALYAAKDQGRGIFVLDENHR